MLTWPTTTVARPADSKILWEAFITAIGVMTDSEDGVDGRKSYVEQRKRGLLSFIKLTSAHSVLGSSIAFQPSIENAQLQFKMFPPFGRGVVGLQRRNNALRLKGALDSCVKKR